MLRSVTATLLRRHQEIVYDSTLLTKLEYTTSICDVIEARQKENQRRRVSRHILA